MGFESLRRHPDSGIFPLRKRVPERLKKIVGKREIKLSLGTTDRKVARIRCLEELAKIERAWSGIDASIIDGEGRVVASVQCKSASDAQGASKPGSSPGGAPASDASDKPTVPLRPLFESYGKEAQLSPATVKRWSPIVDRLIGHLGHDDAAAIARADVVCQSAFKFDPVSASNFDPFERRVLAVALASSELAGIAQTWRARVA